MSRFASHSDMTALELYRCYSEALIVINLCHHAAWSIQNERDSAVINVLADDIQQATRLAVDLLEPVAQALEAHEGLTAGSEEKSTG